MPIGILGALNRPQRQPQKALDQARKLVQTVVGTSPLVLEGMQSSISEWKAGV